MLVNTGARGGDFRASPADHARLPARRRDDLRARRLDLRRRGRDQMAARRARRDRRRVRDRQPGDARPRQPRRLHGPGVRRPWRAALGPEGARRDLRPDARRDRRASCPRRAGGRRLPDARPQRGDGRGTAPPAPRRCGSTAAWPRTTGCASSSPTSSRCRSNGRKISRRRRSARRSSPGWRPASGPISVHWPASGSERDAFRAGNDGRAARSADQRLAAGGREDADRQTQITRHEWMPREDSNLD